MSKLHYNPALENYEAFGKVLTQNGLVSSEFLSPIGVEVGVRHGFFAEYLLQRKLVTGMYLVDPYAPYNDLGYQFTEELQNNIRKGAAKRLAPFIHANSCREEPEYWASFQYHTSTEAAENLGTLSNQFDWVFIDAEHTYEALTKDLNAWYPLVKKGGIIAGHDYSMSPVHGALADFRLELEGKGEILTELLHTDPRSDVWAWRKL